jgi:hypothetical protein
MPTRGCAAPRHTVDVLRLGGAVDPDEALSLLLVNVLLKLLCGLQPCREADQANQPVPGLAYSEAPPDLG